MLSTVEQTRLRLSKNTKAKKKSQFGQFLTSARTAAFMASLFPDGKGICRLLDAGAGIGSLSAAFLDRWNAADFDFQRVELDVFEIDNSLHSYLNQTLERYRNNPKFIPTIRKVDFIHAAVDWLSGSFFAEELQKYTHVILNPPYKKINSNSSHRLALRRIGIETVNLYSAFVALAVALAAPGGQIVAIIPRSFVTDRITDHFVILSLSTQPSGTCIFLSLVTKYSRMMTYCKRILLSDLSVVDNRDL